MQLSEHRRILGGANLWTNLAVAAGAFAMPLIAPLVNLLAFNAYPLLAPEAVLIYAGLLALGVIAGAGYLAAGRYVRVVMLALLVALAADFGGSGNVIVTAAAFVIALFAAFVSKRSLAPLVAFAGLVLAAVSAFGITTPKFPPPAPLAQARTDRPVILHLLLDEHIGVAGLPADNPASAARRNLLASSYVADGFRVYGAAYSQHMNTTNAVPQILNFGAPQPSRDDNRWRGMALKTNAYFDRLNQLGYSIRAYTTGWVKLCASPVHVSCAPYSESGLRGLHDSSLSIGDKAETILLNYMWTGKAGKVGSRIYDDHLVPKLRRIGWPVIPLGMSVNFPSLHTLQAVGPLLADLSHAQPGQAYVAHLLLPHQPYMTRPDCTLKPRSAWRYHEFGDIRDNEDGYFDQVLCTQHLVREAEAAIERSPAGKNYIVVIHGDHGSRINVRVPEAGGPAPNARDMVASYSTMFAIKGPGVTPGYVADVAQVDKLLKAFADSGFSQAPALPPAQAVVYLKDKFVRPSVPTQMPANWAVQPDDASVRR